MNDIDFFSDTTYIVLPTKNNPKVHLAVNNKEMKKNSFKLYNPFSFKAKVLKKIACKFPYFNIVKKEKSEFIKYLEKKLNKQFTSSIYIATDKDKAIIQLLENNKIYGYVKIALSHTGNKKINNEIYAIGLLKKINNIEIITKDKFENFSFFISKEIKGSIDFIDEKKIIQLLKILNRNKYYNFHEHPRIQDIFHSLQKLKIEKFLNIFSKLKIKKELQLVYEHGDFTPWNIIKQNNEYILFDFEYFIEEGIEYFDLIKYYYQLEVLIHKTNDQDIITNILEKINVSYSKEIFVLFLLKEIIIKINENKTILQENNLIKLLEKR